MCYLYHIRDFVNAHALFMFYYSFVYSRLTYGITAWGTKPKTNFVRLKSNYDLELKIFSFESTV